MRGRAGAVLHRVGGARVGGGRGETRGRRRRLCHGWETKGRRRRSTRTRRKTRTRRTVTTTRTTDDEEVEDRPVVGVRGHRPGARRGRDDGGARRGDAAATRGGHGRALRRRRRRGSMDVRRRPRRQAVGGQVHFFQRRPRAGRDGPGRRQVRAPPVHHDRAQRRSRVRPGAMPVRRRGAPRDVRPRARVGGCRRRALPTSLFFIFVWAISLTSGHRTWQGWSPGRTRVGAGVTPSSTTCATRTCWFTSSTRREGRTGRASTRLAIRGSGVCGDRRFGVGVRGRRRRSPGMSPGTQWVREELHRWIFGNVRRKWRTVRRRPERLQDLFVGYHCVRATVDAALGRMPNVPDQSRGESPASERWRGRSASSTSSSRTSSACDFPILLALNKSDVVGADVGIAAVRARWPGEPSVPTSARMDPTGVRRALKAAVGLKPPALGFPVDDLDTGASRGGRRGGGFFGGRDGGRRVDGARRVDAGVRGSSAGEHGVGPVRGGPEPGRGRRRRAATGVRSSRRGASSSGRNAGTARGMQAKVDAAGRGDTRG